MYFKQRLPKRGVLTMVRTWCPAAMLFAEFPPGAAATHRHRDMYQWEVYLVPKYIWFPSPI